MPRGLRTLRHDGRSLNLRRDPKELLRPPGARGPEPIRRAADVAHSGTCRGYAVVAGTGTGGKLRGKVFHGTLGLTCGQLAQSHLRRPTCTEQLASNHLRRPTCAKQFDQSILHGAVCTEPTCTEQRAQSHLQLAQSNLHRATCAEQFNLHRAICTEASSTGQLAQSYLRRAICTEPSAHRQVVRANLHRATCVESLAQTNLRKAV